MSLFGNTFDKTTKKYGHARKVWREVHAQYPAGGTISNVSDFLTKKVVPAGSLVKFDDSTKTITVLTETQLATCVTSGVVDASKVKALGFNGYLYNDAPLTDANTIATGAVVYSGEIYGYMLSANAKAIAKEGFVPGVIVVN